MSLLIRTKIGSSLRTLSRRLDVLSSFLQERQTAVDPLRPHVDHELLIDIEYLTEARLDVVNLFRKIEMAIDRWRTLGLTDPKEKESHASFTTTDEPYLSLISETREILSRADEVLTMLVQEATTRGLDIPSPSDDLSSHGSIRPPHSTLDSRNPSVAIDSSSPLVAAPVPAAVNASGSIAASSARGVTAATHLETTSLHSSRSSVTAHSESSHHPPPLFTQFPGLRDPSDTTPIHSPRPPSPQLAPSLFLQSALVSRAQLPSFDGDLTQWPAFKAAFLALLGDATLPGCHKLAILKSCLTGEASAMISGLSQVDQDYDTAMTILHAEYDRPSLIRHALLARLQSIENCDPEGTQLRRIYMELTTLIHQLCPDGESDSPDFLVNLIITKLPISLQLRVMKETQKQAVGVFGVLDIMREAVDIDRIERLLTVSHSPRMTRSPSPVLHTHPSHSHPSLPAYSSETTNHICPLCDGSHLTKFCPSFKSPRDKKKAVIERGLCLNCLSRSHQVDSCLNRHHCWHCKQRHHTSICTDRTHSREINSSHPPHSSHHKPQAARNSHPSSMSQPARDVTLHINSSPLPQEKNPTLLCLDVNVSSLDRPEVQTSVTLVLDTGSNQSFISKDLVSNLSLPTSHELMRSRTVFGDEHPQSHLTSSHPLLIRLPNGHQEKIDLHAAPSVCPTLDWAEKKGDLLIPRRSQPTILLGMDLLRRFFFTSSLRVDSFPDHDVIHTELGDCISIENIHPHSPAISDALPPDKAPSLGDESASPILSGQSKPDCENFTRGLSKPSCSPLFSFQGTPTHSQSVCPSSLEVSPPSLVRASVTHPAAASKDRDNPHDLAAVCPLSLSTVHLRAGG